MASYDNVLQRSAFELQEIFHKSKPYSIELKQNGVITRFSCNDKTIANDISAYLSTSYQIQKLTEMPNNGIVSFVEQRILSMRIDQLGNLIDMDHGEIGHFGPLGSWRVCKNISSGSVYFLSPKKDLVYHIASCRKRCFREAYHLIRHMMTMKLAYKGIHLVHSSAVQISGNGVVCVGEKKAGKTFIALSLLKNGALYIGNDASYIGSEANQPRVWSFPHSVHFRAPHIKLFNILKASHELPLSVKRATIIHPDKLKRLLANRTRCSSRLSLLVFPQMSSEYDKFTLEEMSKVEVERQLCKHSIAATETHSNWLLQLYDANRISDFSSSNTFSEVARIVPGYILRGSGSPENVNKLISTLLRK